MTSTKKTPSYEHDAVTKLQSELDEAIRFFGIDDVDALNLDEAQLSKLEKAKVYAVALLRSTSLWLIALSVLQLVFGCVSIGLALDLDINYPGYYGVFWVLIPYVSGFILNILVGLVIWLTPKEREGYQQTALNVGLVANGFIFFGVACQTLRTILDVAACNAPAVNWVSTMISISFGVSGDHTGICSSKGVIITAMVFALFGLLIALGQPICVWILATRKIALAKVLYKLKIPEGVAMLSSRLSNSIQNRGGSPNNGNLNKVGVVTDDSLQKLTMIAGKIKRNLQKASHHHDIINALRTPGIDHVIKDMPIF